MNDDQLLRYSRHILLDEMGIEVQERLLGATALIVGAGGLGSPTGLYLAAAGIGRILLADDDAVDLTNLQRQILHRQDRIGQPKAESGRRSMLEINPGIEVEAIARRLDGDAMLEVVARADVVLDCCDNFATRHAVNRACVAHRRPLVSGAAIRFDGQIAVFDARRDESPCYHCLFPEGQDVEEVRCATMGVFAPLTGIVGTTQAAEALKLAGGFGVPAVGRLLMIDARAMRWHEVRVPRDPQCAVCASRPR
ncbi:MAG: molybdopterin-synthase adenylyltransferase MoeB [Lautropia sp.]|nr:MAG: molybdopterin-synthase adenylyltransferase MoeB [Pseudomonadota bacterium]MBC6960716.1 molybdopterin-synthase adenylyltransferase MoeB [Lautropia sp.]MCL4700688.1 molybdopterin-synthase adenylyltransferase MoeB [Burkholderiaceae bacterium]MCZ2415783.1 molybdopterin-synthase adenylyltransferase MoeB [Burkholderiales bacterium]MDL1908574.1 molybdopterin-synthase adenylyltransferase MoeB [Betaproteobacteria bacterium PRO1]